MKPITLAVFAGANQATNERLLPESVGVDVVNARPGAGDLRPLRAPLTVATVAASPQRLTIWRMGRDTPNDALYWLAWATVVSVTLGFDGDDTTERTYFSGAGSPKWTDNILALGGGAPYPQASRELAVPAPTTQVTLVVTTPGTGTESTRFYAHTFVNDLGWESAPSPLSAGVLCASGAILDINGLPAAPAGNYGITARRIYRTQAGTGESAELLFLREVAIGVTSTTDDARALGDALATGGWLPPPANAFALTALWSGMFACLSGKTLHISPEGAPYAYPPRHDIELADRGVGLAKWAQRLLVLTTGKPVLVEGQAPEGMTDEPLALAQPCISARSIVSFGHGAVWASNEGLAYAGERGQLLLTGVSEVLPHGIFTPEQWRALGPSSMVAGRWGRFYVCSYGAGINRRGFMLDPLNPAGGVWFLGSGFDACHYDELATALYVLENGNVRKFDAGTVQSAVFTSKKFHQTYACNYSHAQVVASGYPVTLRITASGNRRDGTAFSHVQERTALGPEAFTLRSGFAAEDWQIEVETVHDVQAVRLATDVRHLKGA